MKKNYIPYMLNIVLLALLFSAFAANKTTSSHDQKINTQLSDLHNHHRLIDEEINTLKKDLCDLNQSLDNTVNILEEMKLQQTTLLSQMTINSSIQEEALESSSEDNLIASSDAQPDSIEDILQDKQQRTLKKKNCGR